MHNIVCREGAIRQEISLRQVLGSALAACLVAVWGSAGLAQPFGIDERVANSDLRIENLPGGGENPVPDRLSDLPALFLAGSGQGHQVGGVFPYEPSAKLWSDHAAKERYIALPDYAFAAPDLARMTFTETDGWGFPENTVVVKNFLLPLDRRDPEGSLKRIETRILCKNAVGWKGFSFEWNEEETDAVRLETNKQRQFTVIDEQGVEQSYTWTYPTLACFSCHTTEPVLLGINTAQMNFAFTYPASGVTDNQLRTFQHLNLFDAPLPGLPDLLPRMPEPLDTSADLESRARAYMAANCSHCHRPLQNLDFRWETPRENTGMIDREPAGDLGLGPDARVVAAGKPELSVLLARMKSTGVTRMPALGTTVEDTAATDLVTEWIESLAEPARFRRGDCDGDGTVNLSDPMATLTFIFLGGDAPPCTEACKTNEDDVLDISDAISTLLHLFVGGPPPPGPYPECESSETGCAEGVCSGAKA